jgi:hypothetical protein
LEKQFREQMPFFGIISREVSFGIKEQDMDDRQP